jgi:hypothetical protein
MYDTAVDQYLASSLIRMLEGESNKCEHLMNLCLFGINKENTDMDLDEMEWKKQIDFELDEWAPKENRARRSVNDFMESVHSRDRDDENVNQGLQFIDDMDLANYYDHNDNDDPSNPPHHLYAIIRAKPHFMMLL